MPRGCALQLRGGDLLPLRTFEDRELDSGVQGGVVQNRGHGASIILCGVLAARASWTVLVGNGRAAAFRTMMPVVVWSSPNS
jgi:hypothetical protein